jgi:hypothetical protein
MWFELMTRVAQGKDVSAVNASSLNSHADTYFATAPIYGRVETSDFTTTSTTLVDITGLSVPLAANTVYELDSNLSLRSSSAAGIKVGVNFSAAGATIEATCLHGASNAAYDRINAFNTASAVFMTSITDGGDRIKGIITTGANAGNLTIQLLKVTSGTATSYIGSFMRVNKIA